MSQNSIHTDFSYYKKGLLANTAPTPPPNLFQNRNKKL